MTLTVGSLFAGVGGFDLALERVGLKVIWNCEIDTKCRKVLARHWPGVPRIKDVRTVTGGELRAAGLAPDVIVGGFPCTDVSVAGKRAGLAGEQSRLFFEFARILEEARPAWVIVENVPGLLSSHRGADMGTVVGHLVDLGYGVAWRVLDAQYFGVAQRRRRVFVVGCLGDRARAAEVLLVGEGGGGDPPARPASGSRTAGSLTSCAGDGGYGGVGQSASSITSRIVEDDLDRATFIPAVSHALCAPSTGGAHNDHNGETLLPVAFHMTQDPITGDVAPAIGGVKPSTGYATAAVAYRKATTSHGPKNDWERWEEAAHTNTLDAGSNVTRNAHAVVAYAPEVTPTLFGYGPPRGTTNNVNFTDGSVVVEPTLAVRRLTPTECERLQGFPDGWTEGFPDSIRYRMLGNAVAVPVVEWLARRLMAAHIDGSEGA